VDDATRFRLLGQYQTPRFRLGQKVLCELRGQVVISGQTDAPIPWPIGKAGRHHALVLYAGLADAVRREAALAVAYWWGVCHHTVWKWRKALGVGATTPGTSRLRHEYGIEPGQLANVAKATAKAASPESRAKLSAARKGKPRPRHVLEAMWAGRRGKPQSPEARAKMSEAHRRRGTRPHNAARSWTEAEDELAGSLPPAEVVRRTGRSLQAVYDRRHELRVPDGRRR